jgi:predicted transcriptional regulator
MPRPRQPGLTENELEVMKILWAESPLKVSDILNQISRKPKPAYTSVLTLIQAMEKKGYIRHLKDGKAFSYSPTLQQGKFLSNEVKRIAKRLFDSTPGALILNLVKQEHLSADEIAELKKLLKGGEMSSLSNILSLGLFLSFSLGLYFISTILDLMKLHAAQKLTILKTGILFLMLAPLIFLALQAITFKSIEIRMPNLYIDPSVAAPQYLPPIQQKIYWPFYVSLFYGFGISVVILRFVQNYFITQKWLSDSTPAILQGQCVQLSSQISSPLSFGFFNPKIYFPKMAPEKWTVREIQIGLTQATVEEYGTLLLALTCQLEPRNLLVTNITDSTIKRRIVAMKSRKIQRPLFTAALSACMLLVGTTAIATSSGITEKKSLFKISSVVIINGKEISRPRVIVLANEKAEITQKSDDGSEFKMELVANDVSMPKLENGIGINFDIQYRFGNISGHNTPQIILGPNKEGSIAVAGDDGQIFEMRIKAERQ